LVEQEVFVERIAVTAFWCVLLGLIWQGLELLIYGKITPRIVDDIMMFLFLPFIWIAVQKL